MKNPALLAIPLCVLLLTACTSTETIAPDTAEKEENTEVTEEETKDPYLSFKQFQLEPKETSARAGDKALAPLASNFENSAGQEKVYASYQAVDVIAVDKESSTVQDLNKAEEPFEIDNNFLIPLGNSDTAEEGGLILSYHQSLNSLIRAYVTSTEEGINANYLEEFWSENDNFPEGSYLTLNEGSIGSVLACENPYQDFEPLTLVGESGDKYLVLGWAEELLLVEKDSCSPMPLSISAEPGDTVFVAPLGELMEGQLVGINEETGFITASYEFVNEITEENFPFGEVMLEFSNAESTEE